MKPTISADNTRKKKIDRPYGESITTVDAYIKLNNQENARKKRTSKDNTNDETKRTNLR